MPTNIKTIRSALICTIVAFFGCSSEDNDIYPTKVNDGVSFLENGKRWEYSAGNINKYEYSYYIDSDTLVGGTRCWKLYVENEDNSGTTAYKCAIYEEAGKVCYYPKGTQDPVVLYDFSLKAGDDIECRSRSRATVSVTPETYTIYKTDTIIAGGITLKRIHALAKYNSEGQSPKEEVWVEGIGGKYDMFCTIPTRGNQFWFLRTTIQGKTVENSDTFK